MPPDGLKRIMLAAICALAAAGRTAPAGEADPKVRLLVEQLATGPTGRRIAAAEALGRMGPEARSAVPGLLEALARPGPGGRAGRLGTAAGRALWAIRPDALTRVLERSDAAASLHAVTAIGGRTGPRAVRALRLGMLDHNDAVRRAAVEAMGKTAAAGGTLPALARRRLLKAVEDGDSAVRAAAVAALGKLGGPGGVEALAEVVRGGTHTDVRLAGLKVLASRRGGKARRLLSAAANDRDRNVAEAARKLLQAKDAPEPTKAVIDNAAVKRLTSGGKPGGGNLSIISVSRPAANFAAPKAGAPGTRGRKGDSLPDLDGLDFSKLNLRGLDLSKLEALGEQDLKSLPGLKASGLMDSKPDAEQRKLLESARDLLQDPTVREMLQKFLLEPRQGR